MKRIDELFGKALDAAVPETWTTLDSTQLSKLKQEFSKLLVQECMNECRKLWYTENNTSTEDMGDRAVGIHIGTKIGIMQCLGVIDDLE
jgi:hypothetical protein